MKKTFILYRAIIIVLVLCSGASNTMETEGQEQREINEILQEVYHGSALTTQVIKKKKRNCYKRIPTIVGHTIVYSLLVGGFAADLITVDMSLHNHKNMTALTYVELYNNHNNTPSIPSYYAYTNETEPTRFANDPQMIPATVSTVTRGMLLCIKLIYDVINLQR